MPYQAPYQPPQPVIHHATDLEDLSGFTDPIKGQHAPSRRCGHFLLKLTANTYPGDPTDHIRIGTGNERSSLERLAILNAGCQFGRSQTSHQTLHKAWVDCIMKVKVVSVITFSVIGIELFTAALFVV